MLSHHRNNALYFEDAFVFFLFLLLLLSAVPNTRDTTACVLALCPAPDITTAEWPQFWCLTLAWLAYVRHSNLPNFEHFGGHAALNPCPVVGGRVKPDL